jgi:hypothetical protein
MRQTLVFAVLGMALPSLAAAQGLGPRTLLPMHVACADIPVTTPPTAGKFTIAGSGRIDGREAMATGDTVVIEAGTGQGVAVGQQYAARRLDGGTREQAFRRGVDGYAGIRTAALLTVTSVDDRFALARIERACDAVMVGDYLEPITMPTLQAPAAAGAPNFSDRASVLFGADLRSIFGDGDVLAINRGSAQGVARGTRFALYRDGHNGLPLGELGEAVVIDVTEGTARAVVLRARDFVSTGDVAVMRGPSQP